VSAPVGVRVDPPLERGTPRRFDIELLRVVAVVGVVFFHFAPGMSLVPNGYLGVDVFFTISGFVITAQMLRSQDRGRLTYPDFLARRVRRLLPSAVLVIVATYAVVLLSRDVIAIESQRPVAIAALLYASNFVFARQSLDYFATVDAPSPFLHYWSLSVEEQFYILWPLVVIAVAFWARRRPAAFRSRLLTVALVLTGVSLVVAAVSMRVAPEQTFFMPWARAHQLLIGAAAAILAAGLTQATHGRPGLAARLTALPGPVLTPLRFAAIGLLIALQVLPFGDLPSPAPIALLVSVPVAFIALTGTGTDPLSRIGGVWPLAWTARLSYVIYLWHWPVWVLILDHLTDLRGREKIALALLATLLLSLATHLLVEQPVRDGRWARSLPPLRTAAVGLGASILAAVTVLGAAAFAPARPWQDDVRPALTALADDKADIYDRGCHAQPAETEPLTCVDGPAGAKTTVLALGDSHAATWQPAFQALAGREGWRFVNVTKSACPSWDVPIRDPLGGSDAYEPCAQWRQNAFDLAAEEKPDVVILHSAVPWNTMLIRDGHPTAWPAASLRAAVRKTVTRLRETGATVVVMLDTPASNRETPVQQCLATADDPHRCDFPTQVGAPERAVVRRAATAAGAVVVDPYPVVCPEADCSVVQDGIVVYRDNHHLTKTYVLHEQAWVRSWLDPLVAARR
jgi:peptidoglycan/LPS O-acetylase OafA/YrhL